MRHASSGRADESGTADPTRQRAGRPDGTLPDGTLPDGTVPGRALPDWTLIASPGVTLAMTAWGLTAHPYWGDEVDTVSAVSRTLPQMVPLLRHIDAVHGLYYLMLWPLARIIGTSELATRLPSAVAMAAAALGITAIGRRLVSRRAGLCAGLVFAALPTVTIQGHDARPYALVTAAAVGSSYLLVRAAREPGRGWLVGYGITLVALGYLHLFGLLLAPAHAVTLAGLSWRRRPAGESAQPGSTAQPGHSARAWLVTFAVAGAAVVPVAVAGWVQRTQIAWIPGLGWDDARSLAATLAASTLPAALVVGLLCLLGAVVPYTRRRPVRPQACAQIVALATSTEHTLGPRRGLCSQKVAPAAFSEHTLVRLALPWLVLPPMALLAASVMMPVYFGRYLTYCVPPVALLAGSGLAALRRPACAGALAVVLALVAPQQLALRAPGGGMRLAAGFLSAHERPGDAIVYPGQLFPPWYLAYPHGFGQLRDISLAQSPGAAGRLYATTVPLPVLRQRETSVRRIWIVPMPGTANPAAYLTPGFRLAREWRLNGGQQVLLYERER